MAASNNGAADNAAITRLIEPLAAAPAAHWLDVARECALRQELDGSEAVLRAALAHFPEDIEVHVALASVRSVGMSALRWTYPQDALLAIKRSEEAAAAAAPVAAGLDVEQLHFNYAISGDTPRWRPLRAFDDGRQTYIEFPASLAVGEAPPLFLVGAKGEAQLVNYRLRGRYYVVDRIFDVAELRLGAKRQEIVRLTRVDQTGRRGRAKGRVS